MRRRLQHHLDSGLTSTTDVGTVGSIAGAFELWLSEQTRSHAHQPVFWAPGLRSLPADWVRTRGVEHLAVLISTAITSDRNVSIVSAAPHTWGRTAGVIGLHPHGSSGWVVNLNEGHRWIGDVRRIGYPYDYYDSFGALTAAEISWFWVVSGRWPNDLALRTRSV